MKLLLIHNFYRTSSPSGEDIVFQNELRLLQRHVDVVLYSKFNDEIDESSLPKRLRLARDGVWANAVYHDLVNLIDKERPQLAHFHNTFPQISPSGYAACRHRNIPVIQTLHNYRLVCPNGLLLRDEAPCELCLRGSLISALRYRCYRGSAAATAAVVSMLSINRMLGSYRNNVDTYIALTEFSAQKMVAGGFPLDRIQVKPNFLPDPPEVGSYPRGRHAIYVGRLTAEKGVWTMLKAWQQVKGCRLQVVGDGVLRGELARYTEEHHLDVEFLGRRERHEVLALVKAATVQVIPSICYEGFPMVVLEAYACGTAVLASRIGGLAEVVREGHTGRLFKPGDIDDLAAVLNDMMSGDQCAALGRAGRREFENKYTEEINHEHLARIHRQTIETYQSRH
ncbi:MAG: glycosyltransferase family 4 protein [Gammaproteobacteria bacterium]|nr:glycosyltransferase family 4 protein [Gammaproteobacteria bacterium]